MTAKTTLTPADTEAEVLSATKKLLAVQTLQKKVNHALCYDMSLTLQKSLSREIWATTDQPKESWDYNYFKSLDAAFSLYPAERKPQTVNTRPEAVVEDALKAIIRDCDRITCRQCGRRVASPCHTADTMMESGPWDNFCDMSFNPEKYA